MPVVSDDISASHGNWSYLTGYGITHPGMGLTKVWVETVELIPRYERVLTEDIGSSWYRCNHSLLIELPVHLVVDPVVSPMVGVNFLACWNFIGRDLFHPYLFAGGGPLYSNADIPGMGAHLNGSYQFGGGLRYKISGNRYLEFEYRFHHISNGGRKEPNVPLNSSKFLVGFTF
ncbi:MAG: acyloxyacyl hydrolase [Desulfobulbaceae bacterium]|nr:acyloxyacyl hydrolase [Desulfobulbaceae bacterium]